MQQMARNLTDSVDGLLRKATYLVPDQDPLFTEAFESLLRGRGVKCVRIPSQSPHCNPHAERFLGIRTLTSCASMVMMRTYLVPIAGSFKNPQKVGRVEP